MNNVPNTIDVPPIGAPNPPQNVDPFPFVSAALDRSQRGNEFLANQITGLGKTYSELKQQKFQNANLLQQQNIQRQLEALKAISDLYGAGGPRAVNAYSPSINRVSGTPLIDPTQGGTPSYTPANGGGGLPSNASSVPQQSAQTFGGSDNSPTMQSVPSPMPMGQNGTGGGGTQPGSSLQSSIWDDPSIQQWHANKGIDLPQSYTPSQEDIADIASGGTYGLNKGKAFEALNSITEHPLDVATKQQQLVNAQQTVPMERGKGSADQQNKYNLPETKIQAATLKLQNLWDAYQAIPANLKGSGVGIATSKAGSAAGSMAPELVTYNKLRDAAAVSLAIARNPENPRPSPQDIADELKNIPSAADASDVATNLFNSTANDLKDMHSLNTQGSQSAAQAFGGQIKPANTPAFNFGKSQGEITKKIGNQSFIKKNGNWYHQ